MTTQQLILSMVFAFACYILGWYIGSLSTSKYWGKLLVKHMKAKGFNRHYIEQFVNDLKNTDLKEDNNG